MNSLKMSRARFLSASGGRVWAERQVTKRNESRVCFTATGYHEGLSNRFFRSRLGMAVKAKTKRTSKPVKNKPVKKKTVAKSKKPPAKKIEPLDLSAFPPEATSVVERSLCLACVLDVFKRHMGLAPRTAL